MNQVIERATKLIERLEYLIDQEQKNCHHYDTQLVPSGASFDLVCRDCQIPILDPRACIVVPRHSETSMYISKPKLQIVK